MTMDIKTVEPLILTTFDFPDRFGWCCWLRIGPQFCPEIRGSVLTRPVIGQYSDGQIKGLVSCDMIPVVIHISHCVDGVGDPVVHDGVDKDRHRVLGQDLGGANLQGVHEKNFTLFWRAIGPLRIIIVMVFNGKLCSSTFRITPYLYSYNSFKGCYCLPKSKKVFD